MQGRLLARVVLGSLLLSQLTTLAALHPVALVVPVHTPKYAHAQALAASLLQHDIAADLYFVLKHRDETSGLSALLPTSERVHLLAPTDGDNSLAHSNVILLKKWWAVAQLLDKHAFFLTIDSEATFIKHCDLTATVSYIHNLGLLFGEGTGAWAGLSRNSAWRYSEAERETLRARLNDWKLYLWWNEMPVVEARAARAFLNATKILDPASKSPTNEFDYLPYAYWMMLHHNWTAVDLTPTVSHEGCGKSLGECGGGSRDTLLRSQPHWVARKYWLQEANKTDSKYAGLDVVMTFHNDHE